MRDQLGLIQAERGFEIEQQQYLPSLQVDAVITNVKSLDGLQEARKLILSHIFTLRKENRHLIRRLEGMEQRPGGAVT